MRMPIIPRPDLDAICRAYQVPPWLVDPTRPKPRHPRMAWLWQRVKWRVSR